MQGGALTVVHYRLTPRAAHCENKLSGDVDLYSNDVSRLSMLLFGKILFGGEPSHQTMT